MTKEDAKKFLYSIAEDLGFTGVEDYTCKDGEKMRDAIKILEQEPCEDVLDKIRAEIEGLQTYKMFIGEKTVYVERDDVLAIIDKHKAESEE